MKATILLPVRNKVLYVERAIRSCLSQTAPCELIIYGPESTDGTDAVISSIFESGKPWDVSNRNGCPWLTKSCTVKWLRTPNNGYGGMNASINMDHHAIRPHVEGDVMLFCSGDDEMAPQRVESMLKVFDRYQPSWIVNRQIYKKEDGTYVGESPVIQERESRWIGKAEAIRNQVGSSGGFAWSTALYDKHGPLRHIENMDVVFPVLALFESGMYYIDEPLQTMYLHDDLDNLGLEGQLRGARDDQERAQLQEINNFHNASSWMAVYRRINECGYNGKFTPDSLNAFQEKIFGSCNGWADAREKLTMMKVRPVAFGGRALGI